MPYLLDRKVSTIDYIIISHFDTDHVQGILYVMQNMKVKNVIIAKQPETSVNFQEFVKIASEKKIKINLVEKNSKITIENNLYFQVLWPNTRNFVNENKLNNNALVCKLCYKNFSCLFTGDIEKEAETELIEAYKENPNILKSQILKVAHHGSKTSSIQEFLELVKPKIALIGVGKNNLYGHPSNETLNKLNDMRCMYM